jgi:hypothetical protein
MTDDKDDELGTGPIVYEGDDVDDGDPGDEQQRRVGVAADAS